MPIFPRRIREHRRAYWRDIPYLVSLLAPPLVSCSLSGIHHAHIIPPDNLKARQNRNTPLIITNSCGDEIYPAILTQSGQGPGTGGFQLSPGSQKTMTVSENWQGRIWGRTNCTFDGGNSGKCNTGDCGGVVSCIGTVCQIFGDILELIPLRASFRPPWWSLRLMQVTDTLITICRSWTGTTCRSQLSCTPIRILHLKLSRQTLQTHLALEQSGMPNRQTTTPYTSGQGNFLGTNASDPLSFENQETLADIAQWCPFNLEVSSSTGPAGGVYVYPDGNLNRPAFDPCFSACAKWNLPQDCCTGQYSSPSSCSPSQYSKAAKSVCPDAYSYGKSTQWTLRQVIIVPSL